MNKKELFKKVEGRLYNYKNLELQINNLELDIEQEKNDYSGSISYDEKTGVTYNISRTVENEVIVKEKRIAKLMQMKLEKEIEKKKIENALTSLDSRETDLFNLLYKAKSKNNMKYISIKLHMDRSHCYRMRETVVYKVMSILYPEVLNELPLLRNIKNNY